MAENRQIPTCGYKLLKERIEQNLGGVSKVGSGPGPNRWLNRCNDCLNSVTEKGRLYSSSFLEEKSRRHFSFNVLIL